MFKKLSGAYDHLWNFSTSAFFHFEKLLAKNITLMWRPAVLGAPAFDFLRKVRFQNENTIKKDHCAQHLVVNLSSWRLNNEARMNGPHSCGENSHDLIQVSSLRLIPIMIHAQHVKWVLYDCTHLLKPHLKLVRSTKLQPIKKVSRSGVVVALLFETNHASACKLWHHMRPNRKMEGGVAQNHRLRRA